MTHYGKALLTMLFFVLSGCQSASKPDTAAVSAAPQADECGASQYQNYLGQPLTRLESQHFEVPVRAIPWNGAVTMDFNLHRLNFEADKSGKISKIYCG